MGNRMGGPMTAGKLVSEVTSVVRTGTHNRTRWFRKRAWRRLPEEG